MAPIGPSAPNITGDYCPEAVVEWYNLTASPYFRRHGNLKRLSLKAKKHLLHLDWNLWYADKKGRQELRYTPPHEKKIYRSLRTACKRCMDDNGYASKNVPLAQENLEKYPLSSTPSTDNEWTPECGSESELKKEEASTSMRRKQKKKQRRKYKKKKRVQPRRSKRSQNDEEKEASSSVCYKRGKCLISMKRAREEDEARGFDYSQDNPRTIISWLLDSKVVDLNAGVLCCGENNVFKKGKLSYCGISCDCCGGVFSLTGFVAHADCKEHRVAPANIILEDERSLLECQKKALSIYSKEDNKKIFEDNICSVCNDGGSIMLCDGCPSSFHHICVGLDRVPDGLWFCPPCCCKICNEPGCTEYGANNKDKTVLVCDQCECKYHIGCLSTRSFPRDNHYDNENWFCSEDCEKICLSLQELKKKPITVAQDNLTWKLLKAEKTVNWGESDLTSDKLDRLIQNESMLHVALGVLNECFDPVFDPLFETDIVEGVIFSRSAKLNRLNFRGFYTMILERNEEVISVANIRIFGNKVAEIPFVATRAKFRRQGMCRILMKTIEKLLSNLGVKRMVLPSCDTMIDTWINSFGFSRMTNSDKLQFIDYSFLDFQDTIKCHKPPSMDFACIAQ